MVRLCSPRGYRSALCYRPFPLLYPRHCHSLFCSPSYHAFDPPAPSGAPTRPFVHHHIHRTWFSFLHTLLHSLPTPDRPHRPTAPPVQKETPRRHHTISIPGTTTSPFPRPHQPPTRALTHPCHTTPTLWLSFFPSPSQFLPSRVPSRIFPREENFFFPLFSEVRTCCF